MARTFTARYDGTCDECGNDFEAGDEIASDGEGGYICEDCAGDDNDDV